MCQLLCIATAYACGTGPVFPLFRRGFLQFQWAEIGRFFRPIKQASQAANNAHLVADEKTFNCFLHSSGRDGFVSFFELQHDPDDTIRNVVTIGILCALICSL